ncbi:MAG: HD domain-containing protein [Lachnospiraceae bacterium]|nr:HD domain-containing protein [Lachnospiraceae bacterium]
MEENMIKNALSHGMCVSNMAYAIAKEMGFDDEFCREIAIAGMIHDIGKIRLSSYLYGSDENTLHIEQMKYVRMHSQLSYDIAKEKGFSEFVQECVLYHHENYDGSGYPENLSGDAIPLGARIIRVCDVFGALISDRAYRKAFSVGTAIELMIDEVKNFDMEIFLAFQRVVNSANIDKLIATKWT